MVFDRQISVIDSNTPVWVNEKLFENLLRKECECFQKLVKFSTKHIKNIKDNYLSVKTEFETRDGKKRQMGFVLKTQTFNQNEKILPYLNNASLRQENVINTEIIPKFQTLYEQKGKPMRLTPQSFKFPQTVPEEYFLYEDLQYKGYRSVQRDANGLSTKEMEFALDKLATLHAASVVEKFKTLNNKMWKSSNKNVQVLANRIFHETLRSNDLREYEDKIKSLQSNFLDRPYFSSPLDFQVLLLNNCCLDNILFHIDAFGNIKDLVFTNLDMYSYGSPAKDLLYLLLSSSRLVDKMDKFEYYVGYYYKQLQSYLNLLDYKGKLPKLSDLHYELIRNNHWAFEAVTQVLPLVSYDQQTKIAEDEPSADKQLKSMFTQENYCQNIQKLLPWMENKAFLEE